MIKILKYLFFLILFTPVFAQETYTLQKLVGIALENSPLIQAKYLEWKSFDGAIQQAGAWQNPSISSDLGYKTLGSSTGYGYSIGISQPFYFPNKQRIRGEIQETFKADTKVDLEEIKKFVSRKVIFLSFAYNEAAEHAAHLEEKRERLKIIHQYLGSRPFVSAQKKIEKTIVENKIFLVEKEILKIKNEKKKVWEELNLYLGLEAPVEIQVKWFSRGIELSLKHLRNELRQNSQLMAQDNSLNRKNLQKKLAGLEKFPDFSLSAIYSEEKTVQTERFIGGGITFNLPLWNRNQGAVSQYEAEISSIELNKSFLEKKITSELNTLFIDYENRRSLIKKYPVSLIEEIHKQIAFVDEEFRKGRIEILTYLEFEQSSSDMHNVIFESQLGYVESYLNLLAITGSQDFQEEK
ncbi:MAG: TolC family protein [Spirochaetia bacterium]|nr:TolC family protein [Spirochaetia bacterium]